MSILSSNTLLQTIATTDSPNRCHTVGMPHQLCHERPMPQETCATRDSCNNGVQFDANAEFRNQIFSRNDMLNLVKWICHYSLTHWGTMVIYAVPWQTHATVEWHSGTSFFGLYSKKSSSNHSDINLKHSITSDISSLILIHTSTIWTVVLKSAIEGAMCHIREMAQ